MLNPGLFNGDQPLQVPGEYFLLRRSGMTCEVNVSGLPTLKASGHIVLSTLRIVFVCSKRVPLGQDSYFESFDFPMTSLSNEKFNQPIFGANNLSGTVQPIANGGLPGPANFKLTFREGGCGTFLKFFFRALRDIRGGRSGLGAAAAGGTLKTESAAFMDPHDPSVIYVVQPENPGSSTIPSSAYGATIVAPPPVVAGNNNQEQQAYVSRFI